MFSVACGPGLEYRRYPCDDPMEPIGSAHRCLPVCPRHRVYSHSLLNRARHAICSLNPLVVALFNAISKRQNQGQGGDGVGSGGKSAAGAAKAASRNAFLNMLKTGVKPESATGAVGKGPGKRQGAGVGRSAPVGVDAEGDGKKRGVEVTNSCTRAALPRVVGINVHPPVSREAVQRAHYTN